MCQFWPLLTLNRDVLLLFRFDLQGLDELEALSEDTIALSCLKNFGKRENVCPEYLGVELHNPISLYALTP